MKKLLALILVCVFLTSFLVTNTYATDFQNIYNVATSEKYICNATVEEAFEDDSIIVVFNNTKSIELDNYNTSDFSGIPVSSVKNLTKRSMEKITHQRNRAKTGDANEALASADEIRIDETKFHQIIKIDLGVKSKETVLKCIKKLEKRDDILAAFPNYIFKPAKVPNDPEYTSEKQWAVDKISLLQAWETTTGQSTVKVGVIDSGINKNHPDLINRYNSTLSVNLSGSSAPYVDDGGHGTMVAGVIGAQGNNTKGIAGVCWNVSLVSLKATHLDDDGDYVMSYSDLADAIDYATINNIPILNYSYEIDSSYFNNLSLALGNYSGLFVCSAGNNNANLTNIETAIPEYNSANTIVVAGTDSTDKLFYLIDDEGNNRSSNYSATKVHLAAPGYEIRTTSSSGGYDDAYGTSLSAPFVTGVAALLKSKYPTMDTKAIKDYILSGVDKIPALSGKVSTGGRLNAYKALSGVKSFTVVYNANGGGGSMANQPINYGCVTKLEKNTYTRDGFTFIGWHARRTSDNKYYYKGSNGNGWYTEGSEPSGYQKYVYKDQQSVARTAAGGATVVMEAQWQKIYTIIFNSNNGTGTMSSMNFTFGDSKALRTNTFTKNRFTFVNWYAKNEAGELYYVNGSDGEWYTAGNNPSTYSRKAFSNRAIINDSSMQGVSDGDVITMCAYWRPTFGTLGDVNSTNTVTASDATIIQKHISNQLTTPLTSDQLLLADVNFDNSITVKDVTLIQRYAAHVINEFGA